MKTHRIRLAGPWEARLLDEECQPGGDIVRCQLPYSVPVSQSRCGVLLLRGFHRPTGIDSSTVLRIVLKANTQPHEVRINNRPITTGERDGVSPSVHDTEFREYVFDITHSNETFNQLSVGFRTSDAADPVTLETAWLEILE
jgi:hypothetical protein